MTVPGSIVEALMRPMLEASCNGPFGRPIGSQFVNFAKTHICTKDSKQSLVVIVATLPPDVSEGTEWALAQAILHQEDEASYASWIQALTRQERAGGRLTLSAPTRFHAAYVQSHLTSRLLAACRAVDGDISDVVIVDR